MQAWITDDRPWALEVLHKMEAITPSPDQAYRFQKLLSTGSSKGRELRISSTLSEPVTQFWLAATEHRKNRGHRKGDKMSQA